MSIFSYSVLSVDGGGIRGIIPCMVLREIEKRSGRPISQLFDLMAGTSTGGILAAGLAIADEQGKPKNSAEHLLSLYTGKNAKRIFRKPLPGGLNQLRLLFRSQFPKKGIEEVLSEEFGGVKLTDLVPDTELFITSYDTQLKQPFYFRSRDAKKDEKDNFLITDACRSTSAAPTYFPPHRVNYGGLFKGRRVKDLGLIDGGVFANNPSVLAYVETMEMFKETDEYKAQFKKSTEELASKGMAAEARPDNFAPPILVISIGTGATQKPYPFSETKGWGVKWLMPLIDILMQGVSESVHHQMQYLLPPYMNENGQAVPRYYRLNIPIDKEYSDFTDVRDETLKKLQNYGGQLIEKHTDDIDKIVEELNLILNKRELKDFM